jgi:8-oxo-dGTP diphosphatase
MSGDILVLRDRKGMWNIPEGKQELGERSIDCAIREVKEETNIEVSNLSIIYESNLTFDGVEWEAHFYFANYAKGKPTLNEPNKIKGIQFIGDLSTVNFSSGLAPLLDYLSNYKVLDNKITQWETNVL